MENSAILISISLLYYIPKELGNGIKSVSYEPFLCITSDFPNQSLTSNFYEFRTEITTLHPTNCKAFEKNAPDTFKEHEVEFEYERCFLNQRWFLRFPNDQVSVNKKF